MTVSVSALKGNGIEDLMLLIEKKIFDVTDKRIFSLELSQDGPHFRFGELIDHPGKGQVWWKGRAWSPGSEVTSEFCLPYDLA